MANIKTVQLPKTEKVDPVVSALTKTKTITLRSGATLEIAEPNALASIDMLSSLTSDESSNPTVSGMYQILLAVRKYDGEPVVTSNRTWIRALIQKLGNLSQFNEALSKIGAGLAELTTGVTREEKRVSQP